MTRKIIAKNISNAGVRKQQIKKKVIKDSEKETEKHDFCSSPNNLENPLPLAELQFERETEDKALQCKIN